jgi:DNA invertase Pin-like site-specific DNA recombinase
MHLAYLAPAGYLRDSDDRLGESIPRQRQQVKKLAARVGIDPDDITWYVDHRKSASRGVRPDYERLMTAITLHAHDVVLVSFADRLWRNDDDRLRVVKTFRSAAVPVLSANGSDMDVRTAEGKFIADVVGAASSFEVARKKERALLGSEDRARKGRYSGGVRPLGYVQRDTRIVRTMDEAGNVTETERPSGPLVLVPGEADAIAWGYARIAAGGTLREVVKEWRRRGLVGVGGAGITPKTVKTALLRSANAGLSVYRGEVVGTGEWPAITDPDTYATVKAILTDPSRTNGPGRPPVSLLSGIVRCGACGGPLRSGSHPTRGKIYKCQTGREQPDRPTTGRHSNRRQAQLDPAINELVLGHLVKNAGKLTRPSAEPTGQVAKAIEDGARLRTKIEAYQGQAADFEPADLAALLRKLRDQLNAVEKKIVKAAGNPATQKLLSSHDIPVAWAALTVEGKRSVIKENVEKIVVGPAIPGRGANANPWHNVEIVWPG